MSVNIQEALAKAREVASKLGGRLPGASSGGGGATGGLYGGDAAGMKRGPDADLYGGDAYKRPAVGGAPAAAYGAPAASYGAPAAAYGAAATPGAAPAGGGKYSSAIASLISGRMGRGSFALPNNYEVEDMTIPTGLVGMVIGRGGETLRGIEEQSQAKVNIAKEHEATADGYRPVTLTGTREAIEVAKKMISERIDMDMARGRPGRREWGSGPNARTEEIKIHQDNVGTIIGKGALTLKEIQSKSNCRVFVQPSSQAPAGDMMRTVFLTGDDEMINKARIMIETLINEGARAAGIENPEAETGIKETLMIKVHRDALGLVIGRGGETIRIISRASNCRVMIDPVEGDETMALITLIADQRHMPYARQLITERIYANNNPMARMMPFYEPMPFDPYFELPPVTEGEIVDLSTVVIPIPPEALMPPPEQAANQEEGYFYDPNAEPEVAYDPAAYAQTYGAQSTDTANTVTTAEGDAATTKEGGDAAAAVPDYDVNSPEYAAWYANYMATMSGYDVNSPEYAAWYASYVAGAQTGEGVEGAEGAEGAEKEKTDEVEQSQDAAEDVDAAAPPPPPKSPTKTK